MVHEVQIPMRILPITPKHFVGKVGGSSLKIIDITKHKTFLDKKSILIIISEKKSKKTNTNRKNSRPCIRKTNRQ